MYDVVVVAVLPPRLYAARVARRAQVHVVALQTTVAMARQRHAAPVTVDLDVEQVTETCQEHLHVLWTATQGTCESYRQHAEDRSLFSSFFIFFSYFFLFLFFLFFLFFEFFEFFFFFLFFLFLLFFLLFCNLT